MFKLISSQKFINYKAEVLKSFASKKGEPGQHKLLNPTRGKIRQHCIDLIEAGLEERDKPNLRLILKMPGSESNYLKSAEETSPDHFKAIQNFLEKTTMKTSNDNVDFVAWLIGFPHRPFNHYKTLETDPLPTDDNGSQDTGDKDPSKKKTKLFDRKATWWSFSVAGVLSILLFLQLQTIYKTKVYICNSRSARKYHFKPNCIGLNACTHTVIETDINAANTKGLVVCELEKRP